MISNKMSVCRPSRTSTLICRECTFISLASRSCGKLYEIRNFASYCPVTTVTLIKNTITHIDLEQKDTDDFKTLSSKICLYLGLWILYLHVSMICFLLFSVSTPGTNLRP